MVFWHEFVLHGGAAIRDWSRTRWSLVVSYVAEDRPLHAAWAREQEAAARVRIAQALQPLGGPGACVGLHQRSGP